MAAGIPGEAGDPAGRTLVYLVRHGQTPLNAAGVLRGLLDPPLDETGRDQARRLGAALGPAMPRAVIASPLRRARQTAQPVADRAGLQVATDPRLIDRDYGQWAGSSRESVAGRWGSVDDAPGVEPMPVVRDRAVRGLTEIALRGQGAAVVVVSHDVVNRQLLAAFDAGLGDPDEIPQDTGCFNTLELRGGEWVVLRVNQIPAGPYSGALPPAVGQLRAVRSPAARAGRRHHPAAPLACRRACRFAALTAAASRSRSALLLISSARIPISL